MLSITKKEKIIGTSLSVILSVSLFSGLIFCSMPKPNNKNITPILAEFDKIDYGTKIAFASPFRANNSELLIPNKIGNVPGIPNMPKPPSVPNMPSNMNMESKLIVLGVLPPNVVILSKNGQAITAKINQETAYGYVEDVTAAGVVIDGNFIAFNGRG